MPEVISLSVESPVEAASISGLDALIGKLERIDELQEKLGGNSRTIRVGLAVDGLEKLDAGASSAERLTGALRAVGESGWSAKLEASATTSEAALEGIAAEARAANEALAEGIRELGVMEGRFARMGEGGGFSDRMARARSVIESTRAEVERLQEAASAANRAEGAARGGVAGEGNVARVGEAVTAKVRLTEETESLVRADMAGAEAARESGAALDRQREIAAGKIGVVEKLTAVTESLAAADGRAAAAAVQAGEATERANGLMSERTRTDERGRQTTSRRFLTGSGSTRTETGESTLEETDYLQRYRAQFEKLDADFAGRRSGLAQSGVAAGTTEHIAVLDAEAKARREIVAVMNAEGLAEDSLALKQTMRANQTDAQARVAELKLAASGSADAQRAETEALRENVSLMDRAVIMERGLATSEEARIDILRRQAAAYNELAVSIAAAGEAPGRAGLAQRAEGSAGRLSNEANQAEAAMRQRRADADAQSDQLLREYGTSGLTDKRRTQRQGPAGTETTLVGERAANGMRETVTLTQKLSTEGEVLATTLTRVESSAAAAGRGVASMHRSLFSNVGTITAWAAGAAVLYGSLNLVKEGFGGMMEAQADTARLENVFKGGSAGARTMRDDLLALAAANGRAGNEAIRTGIAFERLGYGQREVLEATDLALKQANISESTATEVTAALTPVMQAYGLSVSQTRTFLDGLNLTSASANVSNKDLLLAVSRVAPVAQAAGVSLSELGGYAAVLSERTGKAGADVGTMIRSIAMGFENPTLQKFLSKEFKFDVKTDTGDLKQLSTILSELFVKYQALSKADQGELIYKAGGKKQGAALMGLLDGYVESQVLAIRASQELGATEEQNARIRATSLSQLQGINTEFQRLFVNLGNVGGAFGFTSQLTGLITAVGNVLHLVGEFAPVVAAVIALLAVMAVRLVRSAAAMGENVGEGNILMTTLRSMRTAWESLGVAIARTNGEMTVANRLMGTARTAGEGAAAGVEGAAAARGVGAAVESKGPGLLGIGGLALGTLFSGEMLAAIGTIAALEAGMWAFNKAMEFMRAGSEDATDKLASMNAELERTNALLDGADKAGRLAGTLSKALPKLSERDPARAGRAVGDFAGVAYTEEQDAGGGRRAALRDELTTLVATGRIKEAQARLDEVQARLQRDKVTLAERAEQSQGKLLGQQQESLTLLNREIADRKAAGGDATDPEKRRADLMQAMGKSRSEMQRSFATLLGDDNEGGGRAPGADDDFKKSIEARQKGIEGVYAALPTSDHDTEVEKMDRELEKLDARKAMLEAQAKADADAAAAAKKAADDRYSAAQQEVAGFEDLRTARAKLVADVERTKVEEKAGPVYDTGATETSSGPVQILGKDLRAAREAAAARLETYDKVNAPGLSGDIKAQETQEAARAAVDAQGQMNSAKQEEIEKNEKTLAQERESLQLQRDKYARLTDALKVGERQGKIEPEAFKIGRNEVEKMFNEAGGFAPLLEKAVARYQTAAKSGDGEGQNRAAGEALQLGARLTEIQLSLDERRYRIQADIVNERRKENEEASRSLAFAGREDQLRAALLAKYEQTNGRFSSSQFQFLDQSTKEAVKKFTPDALPAEAGGGRGQELQREQALLGTNLAGFSAAVKNTTDFLNKNIKISTTPLPGQGLPAAPQITPPAINFQFAEQFNALAQTLQQTVISRFDAEIASIRTTLSRFAVRNPINPAQTPGADASAGN